MGVLTPSKNEIILHRKMFHEKAKLLGVDGFHYPVKTYDTQSMYHDFDQLTYEEKRPLRFIFEDMPKPQTLKQLGWFIEDNSELPCVAYTPWWDLEGNKELAPKIGDIISIQDPIIGDETPTERKFQVTSVNSNLYYMINYILKLVPFREVSNAAREENPESNDGDYKYLNY